MWILIFLFLISVLILGWVLFGYYIWLFLVAVISRAKSTIPQELRNIPTVSLVVPTYNEEGLILNKIENIKSLDYPEHRLQVIFVDGNSEDKTLEIINRNKTKYIEILKSPLKGKINQLNFALKHCKGDFIFVTDTDGQMSSNSIKEMVKEFENNDTVYVVGAYSYPKGPYLLDRYYWLTQNKGRILETDAFTSSIVVAPCYSFRKGLLDIFPSDVIADDIYISYLANNLGYKVSYINRCTVVESRVPKDIKSFLRHKFRKSNAFLRESLRFVYKISDMNPSWKIIFLTKISQLLLIPYLFFLYLVVGGALISLQRWDVFLIGTSLILLLFLIASRVFASVPTKEERKVYPLHIVIGAFLVSNFILFICGVSFIFFRQDSNYKKLDVD